MRISKYDRRHWGYLLLAVVVVIPFGLFMSYASRTDLFGGNVWLSFGVFIALGSAVWSINILWWCNLDDVHKQGQLTSWYWGGMFGGFAFLIWLIANNGHHTPYSTGAFHMFLVQLALGVLLYGVWKWRGSFVGRGKGE